MFPPFQDLATVRQDGRLDMRAVPGALPDARHRGRSPSPRSPRAGPWDGTSWISHQTYRSRIHEIHVDSTALTALPSPMRSAPRNLAHPTRGPTSPGRRPRHRGKMSLPVSSLTDEAGAYH